MLNYLDHFLVDLTLPGPDRPLSATYADAAEGEAAAAAKIELGGSPATPERIVEEGAAAVGGWAGACA